MKFAVNEELLRLGEEITRQREHKGLTIVQVAQTTKISERFIEKMEQGDFRFLPEVTVKAFLRLLSAEIGLDPEVMVRRLLAQWKPVAVTPVTSDEPAEDSEQPTPEPAAMTPEPEAVVTRLEQGSGQNDDGTQWIRNPFVLGIVLVGLLAVLYYFFYRTPAQPPSVLDSGISVPVAVLESSADTTVTLVAITDENKASSLQTQPLTLSLRATETAWVRIVYQDTVAEEGVFTEGIERSWKTPDKFYLKIGNAGGVRLVLDGHDLGKPGNAGQVVNILIDKTGITPISLAEFPPAMGSSRP